MSVSTLAHPPEHRPALIKFWLSAAFLIAVGVALAWLGASPLHGETTASGLHIRTLSAGSGAIVQPNDGVMIEYEGRLPDGSVFDSSAERGPMPVIPSQTIPGFAEALTHMQKGGRYTVTIPSHLAYGSQEVPGIPPNTDLEFDVSVVELVPNAGLMVQQGQPVAPGQSAPPQSGQADPARP